MRLVHFGLGFVGNLRTQANDLDLAREKIVGEMHELVDRVGFEHLLLFIHAQTEDRTEEVCEADRIVRAEHHHADFRRHLRQISQRLLNQRLDVALGGFDFFFVLYFQLGKDLHACAQEWLALQPFQHADAIGALDDQVQRVFDALHPFDHYQRADFIKVLRFCVTVRSFVGKHTDARQQFLFAGKRGFNRGNRRRPPDRQRDHGLGKQRRVSQR